MGILPSVLVEFANRVCELHLGSFSCSFGLFIILSHLLDVKSCFKMWMDKCLTLQRSRSWRNVKNWSRNGCRETIGVVPHLNRAWPLFAASPFSRKRFPVSLTSCFLTFLRLLFSFSFWFYHNFALLFCWLLFPVRLLVCQVNIV